MVNQSITEKARALAPYLPLDIVQRLRCVEEPSFRRRESFRGAILLFDIAGFTGISDALARQEERGAERLQQILFSTFTTAIEILQKNGGIVYQFAGDSFLAGFPCHEADTDMAVAEAAVTSALAAGRALLSLPEQNAGDESFRIKARITLSYGNYSRILLGDRDTSYGCVVVGDPIDEVVRGDRLANTDQILVSQQLCNLLPRETACSPVDDFFVVDHLPDNGPASDRSLSSDFNDFETSFLKRSSHFIQPELLGKITETQSDFRGEFRELTSLFLQFPGIEHHANPAQTVSELNRFFQFVQKQSAIFGGLLLHTDFTDKGSVFVIVFGAPTALENKELAACRLAQRILRSREDFAIVEFLKIGVATGKGFCGDLGASFRKGYSVIGNSVNLSARLMLYGPRNCIHVDDTTQSRVNDHFDFDHINGVALKGFGENVTVHVLKSETVQIRGLWFQYSDSLVGRKTELAILNKSLDQTIAGDGRVTALTGDAGVGKSRLAGSVLNEATRRGFEILGGTCYSYEKFSPFFPWRELLLSLFKIKEADTKEERIEKIAKEFAGLPDVSSDWIPVMANLLRIEAEETGLTKMLDARQKNDRLFQIIIRLIAERSLRNPLLLVFEDAHWADEFSMELIRSLGEEVTAFPVMLLLVMRPETSVINQIKTLPTFQLVELEDLDEGDSKIFLRQRLNLEKQEPELESRILGSSPGNPFFLESIARDLKDKGYLQPGPDGLNRLVAPLNELKIPATLQDVILSRIDHLADVEQALLKTASVIGRIFAVDILRRMLPDGITHDSLPRALDNLSVLEFTPLETENPLTYIFKHILIRDVAYSTLLQTTRQRLHLKLAVLLEEEGGHLAENSQTLALHFLAGGEATKGLHYTLLSARQAADKMAIKETIHHYEKALEILSQPDFAGRTDTLHSVWENLAYAYRQDGRYDDAISLFEKCLRVFRDRARISEIHMGLGSVYHEMGEATRAIAELETALSMLGWRAPATRPGTLLAIAGQGLLQIAHRLSPLLIRRIPPKLKELYFQRFTVISAMARVYLMLDVEKLGWTGFSMVNIADRLENPRELSLAHGNFGSVLTGLGLLKQSENYLDRGLNIARQIKNPMLEALALVRMMLQGMCRNEPAFMLDCLRRAIPLFQQVGEKWELLTGLSMGGIANLMLGKFTELERFYIEMGEIAERLNSGMHIGWTCSVLPFCGYMLGKETYEQASERFHSGLVHSHKAHDLLNEIAIYSYHAIIAIREGRADEADLLAVNAHRTLRSYQVMIPHTQMCNVYAAEAALFAVEKGSPSDAKSLLKIARFCSKRALKISRTYPYLRGNALRLQARLLAFDGKTKKARRTIQQAIAICEKAPNPWELALSLADAGRIFPDQKEEYQTRARDIFERLGLVAELKYLAN